MVVAGLSLVASVAVTWPLVTRLGSVVHDLYDPVVQAWTLDWVQHSIRSPLKLFDANIFKPEPDTLAYSDSLIGIAVPLLPLRWLGFSPVAVLNAAVIIGSAITASSAYLFGRIVTHSRVVGVVTAAAFAFGPLGARHLGHVQTVWRAGIPLSAAAAWCLADRAEQEAPVWLPALGLLAALSWQATVSFYPTAMALVAALVVLVMRWRSLGRRGAVAAAIALGVSGVVILLLALPYLANQARFDDFGVQLGTLSRYGVDFTSVDPKVWLWGDALGKGSGWPAFGGSSFPGVVLLTLTPIGIVAGYRDKAQRRGTVVCSVLLATGAVLAVGASDHGWRRFTPYRVLFDWVPGWSALRATERAWFIGILGMGVLAGLGARAVGQWFTRRGHGWAVVAVACVATVGILVEGYAPWTDLPSVHVSPVDAELARIDEPGGVVYLPGNEPGAQVTDLSWFDQPLNMYGTTAHHRPTPNGYASYVPKSYLKTFTRLGSLPDPRALDLLRALKVRYVVVHPKVMGSTWARLLDPQQAAPLQLVGKFGADLLYEVPRGPIARN